MSGNPCCKTLLEVAAYSLEANFSGAQLDVKRFEEGHVCKGCFREVDRFHRLKNKYSASSFESNYVMGTIFLVSSLILSSNFFPFTDGEV